MKLFKNQTTGEIFQSDNPNQSEDYVDITNTTEGVAFFLNQAKATKKFELREKRNAFVVSPITSVQAYEVIVNGTDTLAANKKNFIFNCSPTGIPPMEPDVIINTSIALVSPSYTKYSCIIVEGTAKRFGYVAIDSQVAKEISEIVRTRTTNAVSKANKAEIQIAAANTLAELEAINIDLFNV